LATHHIDVIRPIRIEFVVSGEHRSGASMILEVAPLQVRPGQSVEFEAAFREARLIISSMPGYIGHELQRCIEHENAYVLLVRWRTLEDHQVGFRQSPQYQDWKKLLHHFYDPFPTVLHYEAVADTGG
jgi:heme-degrading monooxygenase HmoA